ncbi:spermidine synthase [Thermodesulfobacteriota bacterium]
MMTESSSFSFDGKILYERDSVYHHISIIQSDSDLCMLFGRYQDQRETCISLFDPDMPVLEYTAMMFVGLLYKPETENVALFGLGGGYIPSIFRKYLPHIEMHVIEIDPMVFKLAKKYFGFEVSNNINLTIADGRQYLKRTTKLFDQIWLDAFNSDYIPTHMTTKEFFLVAKSRLKVNGIVVANIHNDSKLFDAQVLTIRSVFQHVYIYNGNESRNSIIVASDNPTSTHEKILGQITRFNGKIGKIDLSVQGKKYSPNVSITPMKILTDDYNPANLWLHKKR